MGGGTSITEYQMVAVEGYQISIASARPRISKQSSHRSRFVLQLLYPTQQAHLDLAWQTIARQTVDQ